MDYRQTQLKNHLNTVADIYSSEGNRVLLKYIERGEAEEVNEKLCEAIKSKFSTEIRDNKIVVTFEERKKAIKFFKAYHQNFILNGRKINVSWFEEDEQSSCSEGPPEPDFSPPNSTG